MKECLAEAELHARMPFLVLPEPLRRPARQILSEQGVSMSPGGGGAVEHHPTSAAPDGRCGLRRFEHRVESVGITGARQGLRFGGSEKEHVRKALQPFPRRCELAREVADHVVRERSQPVGL